MTEDAEEDLQLSGLPATVLSNLIRRGEVTAVEVVNHVLAMIERIDPVLHAFCTLVPEQALQRAADIDRKRAAGYMPGPLAGVPVAVKDLICTSGIRTTFGSPLYADYVPAEDDIVVERLQQADAIVIGKTNTSEFGYGPVGHNPLFATTRNPWNPALTSGGSSAGSAAAVAAGIVPLALGSDGGGSIRIPASLCGIVGLKPSWGRVPLYPGCRDPALPGASGWESLEHIGPLTRTVADNALMLSVLAGPDARDRHSLPLEIADWQSGLDIAGERLAGKRIAYSADLGFACVDNEVSAIVQRAVQRFADDLGCIVEAADPGLDDIDTTFQAIVAMDSDRAGLKALAAESARCFSAPLQTLLERDWQADEFTAAIMARKVIVNRMWRFMQRYDLLITPATAAVAFAADDTHPGAGDAAPVYDWVPFSSLANLTGQPAISIPAGFTANGRPVGLQISGRHLDDIGVLTAAAAFEAIAPWQHLWPRVATKTTGDIRTC